MANRINVEGYTYNYDSSTGNLVLTKYIGSDIDTITPTIEDYSLIPFTISPLPEDATVILTAEGYTQEGNTIKVLSGTTVTYTVSRTGYQSVSGTIVVTHAQTLEVTLNPIYYTLTVDTRPDDAAVRLTAPGYTQVGNTITVPYGTEVTYRVYKLTYKTVNGLVTVTHDETILVTIHRIGSMGLVSNHGTCAIYFAAKLRIMDLGWDIEEPEDTMDYGFVRDPKDRKLDCGDL